MAVEEAQQDSEFELGLWRISEADVRQYLSAVGDDQQEYYQHRLVPPLMLTAYALGNLLDKLSLPPGAIHSLQEVETLNGVQFGEAINAVARLERPRRRGGLEFTTATFTLTGPSGTQVQTGKTTVLVPSAGGV